MSVTILSLSPQWDTGWEFICLHFLIYVTWFCGILPFSDKSLSVEMHHLGQGSVVSVAIHYGVGWSRDRKPEGWGRGLDFIHPFRLVLGTYPASYTMGTLSFQGIKLPGHGIDHPPPSSTEVEESRAIHLLLLWAFMACSRVNFTLLQNVQTSSQAHSASIGYWDLFRG
jgi:hypothetical protein